MPPTIEQDNQHLERLERSHGIVTEGERFHRLTGVFQPLPVGLTDPELNEQAVETMFRQINGRPLSMHELMRSQAIQYRRLSIQHLNARDAGQVIHRGMHQAEHVLANQGVSMSLYLTAAMERMNQSTQGALNLWRTTIPSLPPNERQILSNEQDRTRVYLQRLNTTGNDLLHFSNYRMMQLAYDELTSLLGIGVSRQLPSLVVWRGRQNPNQHPTSQAEWTALVRDYDQVRRIVEANNLVANHPNLPDRLEALEKLLRAERERLLKDRNNELPMISRNGPQGPLNALALAAVNNPAKLAYLRGLETYLVGEEEHVTKLIQGLPQNEGSSLLRSTLVAQKDQITRRIARVRQLLAMSMQQLTQFNVFEFHEHFLKQQYVNLLSGHAEKDGASACAWPQLLEIQALQFRATQILRMQEAIARDERMGASEKVRRQEELTKLRTEIMARLVGLTDELGRYHLDMNRISSIQEQFGEFLPLRGARAPRRGNATEEQIRQAFERFHDDERKFHADRVLAMVNTAKTQFNPNSLDNVRDAAQMEFVAWMDNVSQWFGEKVDWVVNNRLIPTQALRDRLRSTLSLSLKDVLKSEADAKLVQEGARVGGQVLTLERIRKIDDEGAPPGAPESKKKLWNELNELRRAKIREMLASVREPMQQFHEAQEIPRLEDTIAALKEMPPASEFAAGQEVSDAELRAAGLLGADGRITLANVTALRGKPAGALKRNQGATMYRKLLEQANAAWGTLGVGNAEGTGFIGKYQKMLKAFDAITGNRLRLIDACFSVAEGWQAVGVALLGAGTTLLTSPLWLGSAIATTSFLMTPPGRVALRAATWPVRAGARWIAGTFSQASWAGRIFGGAGVAIQGYRTYEHVVEMNERSRNTELERIAFIDALYLSGFQGYYRENDQHKWTDSRTAAPDKYQKPTVFYYNSNPNRPWADGTEPPGDDVPRIQADQISEMAASTTTRIMRHGGDALELAGILIAMRVGSRAVPYLGAAILAIEGANCFQQHNEILTFLRTCKPSVLAHINPMATFKLSHYELLELFSRDAFTSLAERDSVREKLYFSLFYQEISKFPQMMQAVFPNGGHLSELDAFFESSNGGFKDIVLPLIHLRLNRRLGENNVSWEAMKKSRINNFNVLQFLSSPVGRVEIQAAIREAMILAAEDRKERSFRDLTALLARLEARGQNDRHPRHAEMLQLVRNMLATAGERSVYGQRLTDANLANVPAGKTRTTLIIEQLFTRLNGNATASHNVTPAQVTGLPANLNLDDPMTIYNLVTDPVLRNELMVASQYRSVGRIRLNLLGRRNAVEDNGPPLPQYDGYHVPLINGIPQGDIENERAHSFLRPIVTALDARAVEFEGESLTANDRNAHTREMGESEALRLFTGYGMRLFGTHRLQAERQAQAQNRALPRSYFRYHTRITEPRIRDWPRGQGMPQVREFTNQVDNDGRGRTYEPDWNEIRRHHPELTKERVLAVFTEKLAVDGKDLYGTTVIFGDSNGQNLQILQFVVYETNQQERRTGAMVLSTPEQFIARQSHGRIMIDLATKPEHQPRAGGRPGAEEAGPPRIQQAQGQQLAQVPANANAPLAALAPPAAGPNANLPQGVNVVRQGNVHRINGVPVRPLPERIPRTRPNPNGGEPIEFTITREEHVTEFDRVAREIYDRMVSPAGVNRRSTYWNLGWRPGLTSGDTYYGSVYQPADGSTSGMILRTDPYSRMHMTGQPATASPYLSPGFGTIVSPYITQQQINGTNDTTLVQSRSNFRNFFTFYYWDAAQNRNHLTQPPFRLPGNIPHGYGPLLPWSLVNIRDVNATTLHGATITPAQREMFITALTTPFNVREGGDHNDQSLKDILNLCDTGTRANGTGRRLSTQDVFDYLAPMYRQLGRANTLESRQRQQQFLRHLVETLLGNQVNGTLRGAPPTAAQFAAGFEPAANNSVQFVISTMGTWYRTRNGTPPAPLERDVSGTEVTR